MDCERLGTASSGREKQKNQQKAAASMALGGSHKSEPVRGHWEDCLAL